MADSSEETIFYSAVQLDDPAARSAYLAEACGGSVGLRRRVEDLLSAYDDGEFLESPAADLTATALFSPIGEKPGDVIGPYKLLEQIGEGGMGLVFMAEQSAPLRRRVALKIIKPGLDTRAVIARFEAERQALALMDHPNIAKIFDAGTTNGEPGGVSPGRPYFVMELVRGLPITDYCRERNLTLRERLELFSEVCQAVQHAHQKGIIHRDLKPTNILVSQSDTAPVPKVIDFGVAKATTQPLTDKTLFTAFTQLIGTPLYMSPEQADLGNQDIDTRSDVYSLGVVLYEMLTGTTPFDAARLRSVSHDEMRRIIREEEPPKPSTRATTVAAATTVKSPNNGSPRQIPAIALKGDLDWIVMKALDKDRRRRYPTASDLGNDVKRFLVNEVVEARRPSRRYLVQKFAHRHRATLAAVGVLAAILILASGGGVALAIRATRAEGLATARLFQVAAERNEKEAARASAVAGAQAAMRARAAAEQMRDAAEEARKAAEWDLYSSRMVQASMAWNDGDYDALQSLVQNAERGADYRGWEWYFLDHQLREVGASLPTGDFQLVVWRPHHNEMAVYVPRPGHRAAVETWAPGGQAPIRTLAELPGQGDEAKCVRSLVALTWSGDGQRLAYAWEASKDQAGPKRCWMAIIDVATYRVVFRGQPFDGDQWVRSMALSPHGDVLAVGSWDGKIDLWDVDAGVMRRVLFDPDEQQNHTYLEFSPDGDHLAGAFRWGRRIVWNIETGEAFDYQPIGWGSDGTIRWSPDGKRIAASDSNVGVAIYGVGVPEPAAVLPDRGALAICWRDNENVVIGGRDRWINTWNAASGAKQSSLRVPGGIIQSLDLNHDGTILLTNGFDADSARLVMLDRSNSFGEVIAGDHDAIRDSHLLRWRHDGQRLASAYVEHISANRFKGSLRIIDRAAMRVLENRPPGIVRDMVWTPDGSAVFGFTYHGAFHEFAFGNAAQDRMLEFPRILDSWGATDFSPDGALIAYTDGDDVVVRETESLEVWRQFHIGTAVRQLEMSPDAQQIFAGSYDWWAFAKVNSGELTNLSRDGGLASWVFSAAWSPDSKVLAVGVGDGSIELWETSPPKLVDRLVGHQREPLTLDWSSDGRRLASGADDETVRVWDVATGDPVAVFHLPGGIGIFSVQWSPNRRELAAGAENGDIYFFDAGPSFPGADLPPVSRSLDLKPDQK